MSLDEYAYQSLGQRRFNLTSSKTARGCTRRLKQIRKIPASFQAANKRHRHKQTGERTDLAQQAASLPASTQKENQMQETGTRVVATDLLEVYPLFKTAVCCNPSGYVPSACS